MESDKKTNTADYEEMGTRWDDNDLSERWDETTPAHFTVDLRASRNNFAIEAGLPACLRSVAQEHGVSPETLLNLWVREKLAT